jgi:hypothetical protein
MNRTNALVLLAVLAGAAVMMLLLHALLYPESAGLGISGIGLTGIALMVANRRWLHPLAPPLPRAALVRSIGIALFCAIAFTILFGSLGM